MVEAKDVHIISYNGIPQKGFQLEQHMNNYLNDMMQKGMIPDANAIAITKITVYLKDSDKIEPGVGIFRGVNKQMWT